MAINTSWNIEKMTHKDSDGGVTIVYWSCVASSDGTPVYSATEAGKLKLTYDASAADFIPYDDLTKDNVLGWVYDSLREEDETADEAKTRIELERFTKVQDQISRASSYSDGLPWASS